MAQAQSNIILLVDDDEDDQLLFRQQLYKYAPTHQVVSLSNGEELLDDLSQCQVLPDLILLDVNMPRMDGFEALSHIRANEAYQHIYIVMITTAGRELERHKALFLGANQFMVKPTSVQESNELMERLMKRWNDKAQETETFL
ncbi:response regulator [Fibrella forsythiae]|uniref:Response regulator n=1 Tax=Fibrella forsythiae TaxID=2817061 RepID=A0ABS3JNH5_9BACT|nr:response regulator [Fibrella forsythiae]MBO0951562.1 response regulator [Fibrella forsythiae]